MQNVYKSCPKMISQGKLKILTPLQKLPKNVRDLGKLIVAKGFEKLPKSPINRQIWSHWSQCNGGLINYILACRLQSGTPKSFKASNDLALLEGIMNTFSVKVIQKYGNFLDFLHLCLSLFLLSPFGKFLSNYSLFLYLSFYYLSVNFICAPNLVLLRSSICPTTFSI